MSASRKDLDSAFQGAGQKPGIEIWRIENFCPVPLPKPDHGKFYTGDAYIILKTTALKSGALSYDLHYWFGKNTSQDEAGTAAIKAVELDAVLGGRAVQYREVQGHETGRFLSYFKPCIIPREGGVASGFNHVVVNEHEHATRLYICKGKHVVHIQEVTFARSSLNHDDIFILDTKFKIFQFNGSNSSIQERAKALEVVQYIKDAYHDGKCDVASVEDGKLMADADAGEFWSLFGGFAPLPRKSAKEDVNISESFSSKLSCIDKGELNHIHAKSLTSELLDTNKCYLLDCAFEVFVWTGRNTSLEDRKSAIKAAEELLHSAERPKTHVVRVTEGFETVMFRSKFDSWSETTGVATLQDGRGKVADLLKRQGLNVSGLVKAGHVKEEPLPNIDCTGNLQVWRVNGQGKILITSSDQSKFYSGDCCIFQYSYPGENKDEVLIGTWFGKKSVMEERAAALSLAKKMVESSKSQAVQCLLYEGNEPIQFFLIFQCFIVYKGGISSGYKNYIAENEVYDETYSEDGVALFRVQGSGPDNMQAIQVEPVASSLNSSYCYILHSGSSVYTWAGSLTTAVDQELVERQLDIIKPNLQSKPQKEGGETEQFWDLLGGKCEFPSQKIGNDLETDPHLFCCTISKGNLKVTEIFNFSQDDLTTEDLFILDCHSAIYVWLGREVDSSEKLQALDIAENFCQNDYLTEKLSRETPIFIITEGNEPQFFTRFFKWDSAKTTILGNSFQRKLAVVKGGVVPVLDKPKKRPPVSYSGRSGIPDKSQQRSRSLSVSPDKLRVRGRSPAFNALAATFEKSNVRNLSTPPPLVKKLYPKSVSPETEKVAQRSAAIAALTTTFEQQKVNPIPRPLKVSNVENKLESSSNTEEKIGSMSSVESLTIQEDMGDDESEDGGLPIYQYERLTIDSDDPVTDIDVTKREAYLSAQEFREKFGMAKVVFYKLPKWKQNKVKMAIQLF